MSNTEEKEELYAANSGANDMKARPPKNRQADASKYAELFARELAKATIYDPAAGTARSSRTYTGKYTQESLYSYLQSPTTNEKNLRDASQYMYNVNTRYYRLLQYYAGIPTYAYVISPLNFDRQKVKPDTFRKQYMKTVAKLELMNIKEETRKQILTALKDGAYYGVRWSDSSSSFIQKLNPDYCQITHMSDGVFLFSYDMSKVTRETLNCYPPEFERMLSEYEGGGSKWQPVDPSISVCVKADASIPEYSLPPFAAVLPQLYVINDTQALQEASDELDNYKLLAGEVPTDSEGVPTMTYAEMLEYYRHISGNIGNRVGLAFAPFKLTSIDFSKSAAADAVDSTARAVSNFWSSCGTSALLHGAENNTAGVAKLAIKSDETLVLSILDQCERQINRYLKTAMGGTNRFKIRFLRTTVFNEDEMASRYKEALNYGVGVSYYMATLDIPQYDIEGLSFIEDEILDIETILKPLKTASTRSVGDDNSGGRPQSDDTDLTESGEETRDADSNENR